MFRNFYLSLVGLLLSLCALTVDAKAQTKGALSARRIKVAVLDFNSTSIVGARAADQLADGFKKSPSFVSIDRDLARAAARGQGYAGSLNLTLDEARNLGAALDCDFFVIGAADTSRRLPSDAAPYFESYETVFLVSARTGRLVLWDEASARAASAEESERELDKSFTERVERYRAALMRAFADEEAEAQKRREAILSNEVVTIAEMPEADAPEAKNFRPPAPYARLRPAYTTEAGRREVAATVDAEVEIDARGEVGRVEIVRWAGYGLDESVIKTIKKMHFRPAMRDGAPVPIRVLLRYNFRREIK